MYVCMVRHTYVCMLRHMYVYKTSLSKMEKRKVSLSYTFKPISHVLYIVGTTSC